MSNGDNKKPKAPVEVTQTGMEPLLEGILQNQDEKLSESNVIGENIVQSTAQTTEAVKQGTDKVAEAIEKVVPVFKQMGTAAEFLANFLAAIKGDKGDKGDQGERGDKGDKGDQGPKGEDSKVPGPKGDKGDRGEAGSKGERGDRGESIKGDRGERGEKGSKGDKGDNGSPDSGEDIIGKINAAKNSQIDASKITNLFKKGTGETHSQGSGYLKDLSDVAINSEPTDGQALVWDAEIKRWVPGEAVGGGGSDGAIIPIGGTIDDSNVTFTSDTDPDLLAINGLIYRKTGGSITWSWSSGTITLSSPVGTGGSIFGLVGSFADIIASTAETTAGQSNTKAITPNSLSQSDYGKRVIQIAVTDPNGNALSTGDGKAHARINSIMDGYNLVAVAAQLSQVSSSGIPTVQVRNVTQAADMLTTKLTIDQGEKDSKDATVPAVIDEANDDVATGDEIAIDVDLAGTSALGLIVELTFQKPIV